MEKEVPVTKTDNEKLDEMYGCVYAIVYGNNGSHGAKEH